MESLSLVIDADACDRCGKCVKDCPNTVLTRQKDAPPDVYPGRDSMCMGCQHCLAVCPTGALSILGFKPSPGEVFPEGRLPSPENMRALVRTRRSVRRYKRENVSKELLDSILDDLQYAPTGRNDRFLEYLVVDDVEAMDALREKLIAIMEGALGYGLNSPFVKAMVKYYRRDKTDMVFRGAPHLLVVSARPGQGTPAQDVAIALSYF